MLDIVIDVDDSALRSPTQNLQTLRMKEISEENMITVISYLKGTLMLLDNCDKLPTDIIGLIKDIMCSVEYNKFTGFMRNVYCEHKNK